MGICNITDSAPNSYVIITNDKEKMYSKNYIFIKKLKSPIIVLDLKNVSSSRSLKMPIFRNPRQSSIYIIFQSDLSNNTFDILNNLVEISPIPTRPKCLLILSNNQSNNTAEKEILNYSWELKFLDFTILKIRKNYCINFKNYNPFTKNYGSGCLTNINSAFPDKLRDVKKHNFTVQIDNYPPYSFLKRKGSKIIEIKGVNYAYLKIIIEHYNFNPNFIFAANDSALNFLKSLQRNKISISPAPLLAGSHLFNKNVIIGHEVGVGKMSISVPILMVSIELNYR